MLHTFHKKSVRGYTAGLRFGVVRISMLLVLFISLSACVAGPGYYGSDGVYYGDQYGSSGYYEDGYSNEYGYTGNYAEPYYDYGVDTTYVYPYADLDLFYLGGYGYRSGFSVAYSTPYYYDHFGFASPFYYRHHYVSYPFIHRRASYGYAQRNYGHARYSAGVFAPAAYLGFSIRSNYRSYYRGYGQYVRHQSRLPSIAHGGRHFNRRNHYRGRGFASNRRHYVANRYQRSFNRQSGYRNANQYGNGRRNDQRSNRRYADSRRAFRDQRRAGGHRNSDSRNDYRNNRAVRENDRRYNRNPVNDESRAIARGGNSPAGGRGSSNQRFRNRNARFNTDDRSNQRDNRRTDTGRGRSAPDDAYARQRHGRTGQGRTGQSRRNQSRSDQGRSNDYQTRQLREFTRPSDRNVNVRQRSKFQRSAAGQSRSQPDTRRQSRPAQQSRPVNDEISRRQGSSRQQPAQRARQQSRKSSAGQGKRQQRRQPARNRSSDEDNSGSSRRPGRQQRSDERRQRER